MKLIFNSHTFCLRCITKWACQKGTCPECRKTIKLKKLQSDLIVSKIVDDLPVYCSSSDNCKWQGKLENLPGHLKECEHSSRREIPDWVKSCRNAIEIKDTEETRNSLFPQPRLIPCLIKRNVLFTTPPFIPTEPLYFGHLFGPIRQDRLIMPFGKF